MITDHNLQIGYEIPVHIQSHCVYRMIQIHTVFTTSISVTIDSIESNVNHAPVKVAPKSKTSFYATGVGIPVLIDGRIMTD